jgi:hypothetical protein
MLTRRDFIRVVVLAGAGTLVGCAGADSGALPTAAPTAAPQVASSAPVFDKTIYWEADKRIVEWLKDARTATDANLSPVITAPAIVEVASEVETTVAVPLAPTPDKYVKRLLLYDPESVFKIKYIAAFSPRVQAAHIFALIKLLKNTKLAAVAEMNSGEKFWGESKAIQVGIGGCSISGESSRTVPSDALRVKFRDDKNDFVRLEARITHPMVPGFIADDKGNVTKVNEEPLYVKQLTAVYAGEMIADLELTPGVSANTRIGLVMKRLGNEPLTVTIVNNEGGKSSVNVLIVT